MLSASGEISRYSWIDLIFENQLKFRVKVGTLEFSNHGMMSMLPIFTNWSPEKNRMVLITLMISEANI